MSVSEVDRSKWDGWNGSGGPKYPHEKVVQFCFRNFPAAQRAGVRALDLGCGSGVHVAFLAREGFSVRGADISPVGIANTRQRLNGEGLTAELEVTGADEINLPAESLDLVLCVGVFDAAGREVAASAVNRLSKQLRPGWRGLFIFCSEADFRLADGNPLGLHGYTRAEVETLFQSGFATVWLDRYVTTYRNGEIQQNDWLVTVQK